MPAKSSCAFPALLLAATLALPFAVRAEGPEIPVTACKEPALEVLAGRVVDAAGRPIAGAEIWEVPSQFAPVAKGYRPPVHPAVSLAVSGADGRFVTRSVDPDSSVEVCQDGYLFEYLKRPLGARPAEVVLHPASRISGRVLAPDGSPVPGATVSAQDPRWVSGGFSDLIVDDLPTPNPCHGLPSSTDAQGRFTLEPLGPGRYDVWATAAGYRKSDAGRHLDLGMGEELAGVEVRLELGAVVHGRVTTAKGDPVAGAEVSTPSDNASTLTDAKGAYRLTGVSPGRRWIDAKVQEDGILSRSTGQAIEVAPGENRLDLALPPPGREVRGRVLAPDGTPVAGALLHPGSACPERSVLRPHSAADGSFVIHLPAGTGRLVATREGYSPGGIDIPGEEPVAGAVIRLTPDRGLSGRILGWEKGGVVTLERLEEPGQCGCGQCGFVAMVEPGGRYRLPGLWPGEWAVTATVDGRTLKGQVKLTPGAEGRMDLTLPPKPPKLALRGRVVDEEGQPIAGAKVRLEQGPGPDSGGTSAADGTFAVRVESGTWTAKAERAGFIPTSGEPVEVAAPTPRAIELVMARGAVLRVHVRGLPKGQVVQDLSASGENPPFSLDGEDMGEGIYRIAGLSPGKWTVNAHLGAQPLTELSRQKLEEVSKQVTVGAETRELNLDLAVPQGGLTLSGHVVDSMERVVTILLRYRGEPEADFFAYPAPDEPFRFSGLATGKYLLMVKGEYGGMWLRFFKLEMDLDADREVVLHLQEGALTLPGFTPLDDR